MQTRPTETKRSERFKRKALARWRLLAASGVSLEQAALEIGVMVDELRAWSRDAEGKAPLFVPGKRLAQPIWRVTGGAGHGPRP